MPVDEKVFNEMLSWKMIVDKIPVDKMVLNAMIIWQNAIPK